MKSNMTNFGAIVAGALLLTEGKMTAVPGADRLSSQAALAIGSIATDTSKDPLHALKLKVGNSLELKNNNVVGAVENPYDKGKYFILSDGPKASIFIWDSKKESLTKADLTISDGLGDPSNFHIRTNHDAIYITRINSGPLVISQKVAGNYKVLGMDKSTLLNKNGDLVETEGSFMGIEVERGVSKLPAGVALRHLSPQETDDKLQYKAILKVGSTEYKLDNSLLEISVKRAKVNDGHLYLVKLTTKEGETTIRLGEDGKIIDDVPNSVRI